MCLMVLLYLDPISGSAPKFPQESEFTGLTIKISDAARIKCAAQGFPVPSYRY